MSIIATDITYIPNQDIYIDPIVGDFTISESDYTHISDILYSNAGDWRQYPTLGCNINSYINSKNEGNQLQIDITNQLVADGYQIVYLNVANPANPIIEVLRVS